MLKVLLIITIQGYAILPFGNNAVFADPIFRNKGGINANDYKLQANSPTINSGVFISNNGGQDYWGVSIIGNNFIDIGAYEVSNQAGTN